PSQHCHRPPFPTRRSSDLRDVHEAGARVHRDEVGDGDLSGALDPRMAVLETVQRAPGHAADDLSPGQLRRSDELIGELTGTQVVDRKSTRLNSSHQISSYA